LNLRPLGYEPRTMRLTGHRPPQQSRSGGRIEHGTVSGVVMWRSPLCRVLVTVSVTRGSVELCTNGPRVACRCAEQRELAQDATRVVTANSGRRNAAVARRSRRGMAEICTAAPVRPRTAHAATGRERRPEAPNVDLVQIAGGNDVARRAPRLISRSHSDMHSLPNRVCADRECSFSPSSEGAS
jgi:hypothetical protein